MDEQLLQVLRNITREHMRLLVVYGTCTEEQTRSVVCVDAALEQMRKYDYKQNNPL